MASGGSATRSASVRSFDFGSDDVLCAYDEYTPQMDQSFNGKRSDSLAKDLHESRVGRPLTNLYGQPEEISREDVISAVEKCMKKYADNLTRNLEGISGRLTQLELYCFKLERSIGEFRADMVREQSEADLKLKSLEKHIYEVHRSVQIIRDKQELSETQMELAELQLPQKKPTNSTHSQKNNEFPTTAAPEIKAHKDENDSSNLQLALTHPHQTSPTPDQNQACKVPPMQHPAPASLTVPPHDHYVLNQPNSYYTSHQPQSQNFQPPPFTQYRPQWSHPIQPLQSSSQPQAPSPQNPSLYARYLPNQPTNTIQTETYQGSSMAPPAPYITVPQTSSYGTSGGTIPHVPSQHNLQQNPQISFRPPLPQSNMPSYNAVYVIDGSRAPHPHYPPSNNLSAPQILNNHPYGEMIEKAVSMGYPRDQVIGIVQAMGESGQPLDLNALLDRLNAIASGGMRRPWSG
ncbi:class E vacuolar protein-sorting machinery protein HSE1 isoform X2 [Phalaenopsis equestris]|uniref:class E vacuolar protein-sorting machinery protein HSE1 isoform X2 n=1 Tax=Phalaenopsis equestris TaxID=78828 RepID=UPI0009E2BD01|nr:class E vacuolar protein-sorting machinery protein HSE1 isoform X2 [Phalaenopsis equestris]